MTTRVIVGAQWGDEGKGKFVDYFAKQAQYVVRFQGGNNAGHTLVVEGRKTVLHHIPSGILRSEITCVVAGGTIVDPFVFLEEVQNLKSNEILKRDGQLVLGNECSVITPYHRALDAAREGALEGDAIGTTKRGIGPCYEDRAARRSIFVRDLVEPDVLRQKLERSLSEKNQLLEYYGIQRFDLEQLHQELLDIGQALQPYMGDSNQLVRDAVARGDSVLFEGAQGTLLDIGLGTYPYVTSSHTTAGAVAVGTSVAPSRIGEVIAITKAYCTRVGAGPFPTELKDEIGGMLRDRGHEFGSTTGRPRRCGWIDAVALRYAVEVNGVASLAMTKLDVLSGIDSLKVCTGYRLPDGSVLKDFPLDARVLEHARPIYETLEGWQAPLTEVTHASDLPDSARHYVAFIEECVGAPVSRLSVGPGRDQTFANEDST